MTSTAPVSPASAPAAAAAATTAPAPRVISWLREPNLPGRAGQRVYTEWVLRNDNVLEAHRNRYVEPLGGGSPVLPKHRFGSQVPAHAQQAVRDAVAAAAISIAASPDLARMQEVPSDDFFFGPVKQTSDEPFGQTPDIGIGQGKVLVDTGDSRKYYVGNLRDMQDIVSTTKRAATMVLEAK